MRKLIVLRGAQGSGKSFLINKLNLNNYTLSIDAIRSLFYSPRLNDMTGQMEINLQNDTCVWNFLFDVLEKRMERGELTVIDAIHSKSLDFSKYKHLLDKYRYRGYCIDLSATPLDECLKRNSNRDSETIVNEDQIKNIYSRFKYQNVPTYFKTIKINNICENLEKNINDIKELINIKPLDINNKFDKIVCFGDIHGCFKPLEEYFNNNPINEKTLYVFLGDYIDRGLQNDKVIEFLLDHYLDDNFMLLQGNHENWLIDYANNEYKNDEELLDSIDFKNNINNIKNIKLTCKSYEFIVNTRKQIKNFNKRDLRKLCRKFLSLVYLKFDDKLFFITHAGIGQIPKDEDIIKIPTKTLIRGNKYSDDIDKMFEENNKNNNLIQIHGHRNTYNYSIDQFKNIFNLNGDVELGKELRIIEIKK